MKKYDGKKVVYLCGLILAAVTICIYLLGVRRFWAWPVGILSLFFILLSEGAVVLSLTARRQTILRFSITTTALLYFLATALGAILFLIAFPEKTALYVLFNLVLIALAAIIIVCLNVFATHAESHGDL